MPFQIIFENYFDYAGKKYLIVGDRLSGWTEVMCLKTDLTGTGAKGLCEALRSIFACFGVPEELSSDGGPEFSAQETADFLIRWGVKHRISSAYFAQSNGRAEVAVKCTKRLLMDNVGDNGSLNTDQLVRALLQLRNTPDRDCNLSPSEVLFGRRLRDTMPVINKRFSIYDNEQIHGQWHSAWAAKEGALRSRLVRSCEQLEDGAKELPPLREGDTVFIQNQKSVVGQENKWDKQGTVIAVKENDQYLVKVEGSGRLTVRNRRFLRMFKHRSDATTIPHFQNVTECPNPTESSSSESNHPDSNNYEFSKPLNFQDETSSMPNTSAQTICEKQDENNYQEKMQCQPTKSKVLTEVTTPVRASTRMRKQQLVYDASTGQYAKPVC